MGTIGDRITDPMDLFAEKSVYVNRWLRPCSVAFIVNMQFKELAALIKDGVFKYTPNDKTNKPTFNQIVHSYKGEDGLYKYPQP